MSASLRNNITGFEEQQMLRNDALLDRSNRLKQEELAFGYTHSVPPHMENPLENLIRHARPHQSSIYIF